MFKFEANKCYRMPAHFGGYVFDPAARDHDALSIQFTYTTDGDQLSGYLPEGFELTKPELGISFQQLRQVDWLYGSGYNLIWVSAPVRFKGQRDQIEGDFAPVAWENKTTPILRVGIWASLRFMRISKIYKYFLKIIALVQVMKAAHSYKWK
jgi:acetoacetate decarboxylase